MNDISDWYDEDRAIEAEIDWILHRPHDKIIEWLRPKAIHVSSIIEFGCGSGIVAAQLQTADYLGLDTNPHFLRMMHARCPNKNYTRTDIRDFATDRAYDLAMAWNFLKHFSIKEFSKIVCLMLRHARYGAFNVQVLDSDMDDGTNYHHVYVTEARLTSAILDAGHREKDRLVLNEWTISEKTAKNVLLWTERTP